MNDNSSVEGTIEKDGTNVLVRRSPSGPVVPATEEERKPFYTIGYAGNDGERQAEKDWKQEAIKPNSELEQSAKDSWYVRIENPNILEEMNIWGRDFLRTTYLTTYKSEYELAIKLHNESLPDDITIELRDEARRDQREDALHGKSLLPVHIEYRAVIRAYEQTKFNLDAEVDTYFGNLCNYVRVYQKEYEQCSRQKEETE